MIPLPSKPKIIKQENNRAVFEIEGCYPGYGITLGNAFRRVLLSSLPGAAVTGVKIKGIQHEFSTIPYVMEDVIEIILNLKQLRFRLYGHEPCKLSLKIKGEKEVKASDIKGPSNVEIINKNAHIATLTDKRAELEMEIDVEPGIGYSPVEQRHKEKLEIGFIPVDAIFSPIRKVNFEVENMRVGDRTDYNRLRFDIETDGSISPIEAFKETAKILVEQFGVFTEQEESEEKAIEKDKKKKAAKKEEKIKELKKMKIDDLKIPTRTLNILKEARIKTISDLVKKSEASLLEIEGMGERGIKEIKKELSKLGLELK